MRRYTDFIPMGAQTTGVSLIDFNRTTSTMNGLGLVYKMHGDNFAGAIPVTLSDSPQPAPKFPAGSPDQPEKPSGSPTYPLDMYAAFGPDRKYLIVSVVNATESEQKVDLSVTGAHVAGPSTLGQLTANSLDALNHAGQAPQLAIKESAISSAPVSIAVAPISVKIYRFPMAQGSGEDRRSDSPLIARSGSFGRMLPWPVTCPQAAFRPKAISRSRPGFEPFMLQRKKGS